MNIPGGVNQTGDKMNFIEAVKWLTENPEDSCIQRPVPPVLPESSAADQRMWVQWGVLRGNDAFTAERVLAEDWECYIKQPEWRKVK